MLLTELLKKHCSITLDFERDIAGLAIDSRHVSKNDLFFAYKGTNHDGKDYINDAISNGASVILIDGQQQTCQWQGEIPLITISHLKEKISEITASFYHNPAKSLRMIGITGTNGKTSCSHFIATSLSHLGISCGVMGTLGNGFLGHLKASGLTTPDPITLHATFDDLLKQGAKAVAMEVSSHSLDQGRIKGIDFEVGVFTNLTQDHLDYHLTMEAYGQAKRKLFGSGLTHAVINADDHFGRELIHSVSCENVVAYSVEKAEVFVTGSRDQVAGRHVKNAVPQVRNAVPQVRNAVPQVRNAVPQVRNAVPLVYVEDVRLSITGIRAIVHSPWGSGELNVPLVGKFNLSNVLAVLTTLCAMGISFEDALKSLSLLTPVPGRMEMLGGGDHPLVVVDYAHTPDSLEKTLLALRAHCEHRLHCLFGCGGDRDRGKRPLMGGIAEKYADRVIVTDDNPRTEDPEQIVADILGGFLNKSKAIVEHNRSKAIVDIIQYARPGDCVLIAGKGAETYQQIGDKKIPFSDVSKVKECLSYACLVK